MKNRPAHCEISGLPINWDAPTPKSFWTYQAPTPPAAPAHMTTAEWESLSPGMRREIARQQPELWGAKS